MEGIEDLDWWEKYSDVVFEWKYRGGVERVCTFLCKWKGSKFTTNLIDCYIYIMNFVLLQVNLNEYDYW